MAKASSISDKAGEDAVFLRKFFLSVINNKKLAETATGMKVRVEAAKNLARLQHLLQVDKTVEKTPQEKKKAIELSTSELADANELLNAN